MGLVAALPVKVHSSSAVHQPTGVPQLVATVLDAKSSAPPQTCGDVQSASVWQLAPPGVTACRSVPCSPAAKLHEHASSPVLDAVVAPAVMQVYGLLASAVPSTGAIASGML